MKVTIRRSLSMILSLFLVCSVLIVTPTTALALAPEPVAASAFLGRAGLATLTNASSLLYVYDQIAAGVESMTSEISLRDGPRRVTEAELDVVMDAYLNDHPSHFWLDKTFGYSVSSLDQTVTVMRPHYLFTGSALTAAKTAYEAAAEQLLTGITTDMSEYERVLLLHDRLCDRLSYGFSTHCYNAYGALVEHVAVCEGYTKAYQDLLYRAGILNVMVTGKAGDLALGETEAHAWNMVRIDGSYYYVDVTWDDHDDSCYHAYFAITDTRLAEDHCIDRPPYSLPSCTDPSLQLRFFNENDGVMGSEFSVSLLIDLLDRGGLHAVVLLNGATDGFWAFIQASMTEVRNQLELIGGLTYGGSHIAREWHVYVTGLRRGDPTLDGFVNADDVEALMAYFDDPSTLSGDALTAADVNKDDSVTPLDLTALCDRLGIETADLTAARAVDAQITALPDPIGVGDEAAVTAARAAYDALTAAQRRLVENLPQLQAAEAALAQAKQDAADQVAADAVSAQIAALPATVTLADEAAVTAARAAYHTLTAAQQARVGNLAVLTSAEAALAQAKQAAADQAAADAVADRIAALPSTVTVADEAQISAARAAYYALTDAQRARVTNLAALTEAEAALERAKQDAADQAAADAVSALIADLPATITVADVSSVMGARAAYDQLTDAQRARVAGVAALTEAEAALDRLREEQKEAVDQAVAQTAIDQIAALPDPVTAADQATVEIAQLLYQSLTPEQQAMVTNADVLEAAVQALSVALAQAERDRQTAEQIDALIGQIPHPVTRQDAHAVAAARAAFDQASAAAQALVTNLALLEQAEQDLANLPPDEDPTDDPADPTVTPTDPGDPNALSGDVDGSGKVDASDALMALKAAVGKLTLSEQQTRVADLDSDEKITASDALMILKIAVGKA